MVLTKIMSQWRWCLGCLVWVSLSCAAVAWTQTPPLPALLGARVDGVLATSNVVVDVTLDSASTLSGRVLDVNGMPAFFATVFVQSETAIYSGAVSFEQGLQYRIVLPDGTYSVSVMMSVFDPTGMTPGPQLTNITFDLLETVVVSGDTVRDFVTPALPPLLTVTGQIFNFGTLDVPQQANLVFQSEDRRVWNLADIVFNQGDLHATYSVVLPAGIYNVFLLVALPDFMVEGDPEVPRQVSTLPVSMVAVSGDQMFDVNVPATVTLSGLLQDGAGNALAGATVVASATLPQGSPDAMNAVCNSGTPNSVAFVATGTATLLETNTLGQYENLLVPGDYQVLASTPVDLIAPATVPPSPLAPQRGDLMFPFRAEMLTITVDQMRNFILPPLPAVVLISGRVTDRQGLPVFSAQVTARSEMLTMTPNASFSNDVRTNQMGEYQLLVLSGVDYTVRVCPPTRLADLTP